MDTIRMLLQKLNGYLIKRGFLLIMWGYMMGIMYATQYLVRSGMLPSTLMDWVVQFLPFLSFSLSVIYLLINRQESWIREDLKIIGLWLAALATLIIINWTLWKTTGELDFTLQHPLFMAVMAFAIVATGILKNFVLLIYGGITFGLLAFVAASFPLTTQLGIEAIAWLIGCSLPGHLIAYQAADSAASSIEH